MSAPTKQRPDWGELSRRLGPQREPGVAPGDERCWACERRPGTRWSADTARHPLTERTRQSWLCWECAGDWEDDPAINWGVAVHPGGRTAWVEGWWRRDGKLRDALGWAILHLAADPPYADVHAASMPSAETVQVWLAVPATLAAATATAKQELVRRWRVAAGLPAVPGSVAEW